MLKILYEILTSPLGLPISPIWEYIILLIVGEVVHEIAWDISPGGQFGSAIYWGTKLIAFVAIWVILYAAIWVIKFVIANLFWFTIGLAGLALILFIVEKVLSNQPSTKA